MRDWTLAGSLLWQARQRRGLTQAALAERAGVPQSTIAAIETGRREPSLPTLLKIIEGADLTLRMVLDELDDHDASLTDGGDHTEAVAAVLRRPAAS